MEPQTLLVEKDGPTAVVTLNRPRNLNTLSVKCLRELKEVFPPAPGPTRRSG